MAYKVKSPALTSYPELTITWLASRHLKVGMSDSEVLIHTLHRSSQRLQFLALLVAQNKKNEESSLISLFLFLPLSSSVSLPYSTSKTYLAPSAPFPLVNTSPSHSYNGLLHNLPNFTFLTALSDLLWCMSDPAIPLLKILSRHFLELRLYSDSIVQQDLKPSCPCGCLSSHFSLTLSTPPPHRHVLSYSELTSTSGCLCSSPRSSHFVLAPSFIPS